MQRLIIKVQYGDGYTYSGEDCLPVVFSSKEEFLIELEDMLIKIQSKLKVHDKAVQKQQDKLAELFAKSKHKGKNSECSEIMQALIEHGRLQDERHNVQTFKLGRRDLSIEMFGNAEGFTLPEVLTLDEYFAEVENNAE